MTVTTSREADLDLRTEVLSGRDQLQGAATLFRAAMVGFPPPADDAWQLSEPGRTLGAFADGGLVGTADSYTSRLVVPGGARVPHAAVTHIGVVPTHTRRGVVTALVRHQLADIAARGELVATLRASEGMIYRRFGYGIASHSAQHEVFRRSARLHDGVGPGGLVRLLGPTDAKDLLARIYESDAVLWTGAIDRPSYWWRSHEGHSRPEPEYVVVHGRASEEDGFVRYHPEDTAHWFTSRDRSIVVDDFVAHTDEAYVGLIRHLLSVDLVDRIVFASAPIDDPLSSLLVDERALRTTSRRDETWLRLVDVGGALSARRYRGSGSVVVAVRDDQLAGNTGSYLIAADGVERTNAPAHLSVDVATLAALYLGGSRWWQHARSGRVTVHRDGALATADELFATDVAPYSGTMF